MFQPFSPRTKERGTVLESTTPRTEIFSCSETGCVLTFKTEAEAEAHMDSGQHVRQLESESGYDIIRKKWAEKVSGVSVPSHEEETRPVCHDRPSSSNMVEHRPKGWALKTSKRPSSMTDPVKAYLEQKFDAGSGSELKAVPILVSNEMKLVKDKNGKLLFSPEEWRTAQKISRFFLKAISNTAAKASRARPVRGAQGGNFRGRFRSAGISNCLQRFTPGSS